VLTVIFILVATFLFLAMLPRPAKSSEATRVSSLEDTPMPRERRMAKVVIGAVIASIVVLFVLLFVDFFAGRSIYALNDQNTGEANPVTIKVTGHQWWWQVDYENQAEPSKMMTTANELHVPIGRPVKLTLQSSDVIHSFWVPNMHGKKDLVPGHPTEMWLKATRRGTFRGQCAEFCGLQHAHMRLTFVAETPEQFAQWMQVSSSDAPPPTTDPLQHGRDVFMTNQCIMCHTINGTNARGTVGPDLTHIASRPTLAAGAIPNTRDHLAVWIANPHKIKPGVRMPATLLPANDLEALLDYLELLK
jgi:cytochrome c oxidase subunit 2